MKNKTQPPPHATNQQQAHVRPPDDAVYRAMYGTRPIASVPPSRRNGPFIIGVQIPTTAGDVSVLTDGAFYADPALRARWSPTSGGTGQSQTIKLHIEAVELIVWDSDILTQAVGVVDDLFAASPQLYGTIQGQPWAMSIADHIRTPIEVANNSNATAGAYPRRLRTAGRLVLPEAIAPNAKLGDTLVVRTVGNLTAALDCWLKVWGYAEDAGLDDGTEARQPFTQGCEGSFSASAVAAAPNGMAAANSYHTKSVQLATFG